MAEQEKIEKETIKYEATQNQVTNKGTKKESIESKGMKNQEKENTVSKIQVADHQALEENICDTIKEWQMKIGYRREKMQLFYKDQSICSLLNIDLNTKGTKLGKILADFSKYSADRLGECRYSYQGSRWCIEVSEQGTLFVKEQVKESLFLKDFIETVTKRNVTLEEIKSVFSTYSKDYVFEDRTKEDLGYVFFFQDDTIDKYVYCIELDEFGTTYHRFTKKDYEIFVA